MCHIRLFFAPRCVNRDVPPLRVVSCREGFLPCLACACVEVDPKKPSIQQQFGRCFYSVFVVQNWGWHGWSPSKSTGKWSWGSKQNDQWPMAARPAWWLLYWLLYFWIWFKYQYHRVSVDGMSAVCWHMFTNVLQSVYKYIYIYYTDRHMNAHIFSRRSSTLCRTQVLWKRWRFQLRIIWDAGCACSWGLGEPPKVRTCRDDDVGEPFCF